MRHELRLKEAAAQRVGGAVTIGSYYRTVQQARENLRKSIAAVVVGITLGLVRLEDVRRLLELVSKAQEGLPEDEEERFARLIEVLLQKLVM